MILMAEFIEYINNRGFTNNTKEAYIRDVNRFCNYLDELNLQIYDIDNILVLKYLNWLKSEGKANSTIIRNLSSVNKFLAFLYRKRKINENIIVEFKRPIEEKKLPVFLTVEEVDRLLNVQDLSSFKGTRDRCMLELMYACGLKVSELIELSVYDIAINEKQIFLRKKGKRTRNVPIGNNAKEWLQKYKHIRDVEMSGKDEMFFLNCKGGKISRQGFWKIVKEYGRASNIQKNINTYTLRHSFAIHLMQNGADIRAVQRLLGHKNLVATAVYKEYFEDNTIREIYNKTHPRA